MLHTGGISFSAQRASHYQTRFSRGPQRENTCHICAKPTMQQTAQLIRGGTRLKLRLCSYQHRTPNSHLPAVQGVADVMHSPPLLRRRGRWRPYRTHAVVRSSQVLVFVSALGVGQNVEHEVGSVEPAHHQLFYFFLHAKDETHRMTGSMGAAVGRKKLVVSTENLGNVGCLGSTSYIHRVIACDTLIRLPCHEGINSLFRAAPQ